MGAKDVDVPDADEYMQRFDEWLVSPLKAVSSMTREQRALRKVLLGHD